MQIIRRRLYLFAMLLAIIVFLGLSIQYSYLNKRIIRYQNLNIEQKIDKLSHQINDNLKYNSQYLIEAGEQIATEKLTNEWIEDYFYRIQKIQPSIKQMYFVDTNNQMIISHEGPVMPEGFDFRKRDWYISAVQKNTIVFTNVYIDKIDNNLVMSISKPVYNSNKNLIGVVAIDISMEGITDLVQHAQIADLGYSFIIDGTGNLLAHPKYQPKTNQDLVNINSLGIRTHEEMMKKQVGKIEIELDGVKGDLSYRPIQGTDWIIGNFISLNELQGNQNPIVNMLIIVFIIAIFIFISFVYLNKVNILNPIEQVEEDIQKINLEENIAYRIPISEKDPFIKLRKVINWNLDQSQVFFERVEQGNEELIASGEELEAAYGQLSAIEGELREQYTKLLQSEEKLTKLSYHDQLTGLYNRRFFEEELSRLDDAENLPLSIIMADVNGLKLINDSFGHTAGDELLETVACIMKEGCRKEDIVARIGGDEFIIILSKTSIKEAEEVVTRLKKLNSTYRLKNKGLSDLEISVSYGTATKYVMETSISEIFKVSEDNMYKNKLAEGPSMRSKAVDTILKALYELSKTEELHSKRVSNMAEGFANVLGLGEDIVKKAKKTGLLHDIGKVAISKAIWGKSGKLDDMEMEAIKEHPAIGYRILNTVNEMSDIAEYVLKHHERYDGLGYPKGLKGDEIPLISRIIAIVNAYDVMAIDQVYRKALSHEQIIEEFKKNAGTQFDPYLAEVFVEKVLKAHVDKKEEIHDRSNSLENDVFV